MSDANDLIAPIMELATRLHERSLGHLLSISLDERAFDALVCGLGARGRSVHLQATQGMGMPLSLVLQSPTGPVEIRARRDIL